MPKQSWNVCLWGKIRSDWPPVKTALFTRSGHRQKCWPKVKLAASGLTMDTTGSSMAALLQRELH